jgi:hypothetical protein
VYTVKLTVSNNTGEDTDRKTGYVIVEAGGTPAELVVRDLYIDPVYAEPREPIVITANVYNQGGAWGSATVYLLINGEREQQVDVGVAPGTSQPVNFTVYRIEGREYQIELLDALGTFYVMEEEEEPAPTDYGPLDTGGIIAVVVIAIILIGGVVVVFLLSRR